MSRFTAGFALVVCLSVPVFGVTRSWTGAVNGNWSEPNNWTPSGTPSSSDALIFPAGVPTTMNNDLPAGTAVGSMTFHDTYTLNGNPLTLNGNVVFDTSTNIYWFCNVDLKLGQSINVGASLQNVYTGTVDVNGHTLTTDWYNTEFHGAFKGTGSIVAHDTLLARGGGTFSGNISGAVDVAGSMPNANVDASSAGGNSSVSGSGSLGDVTATYLSPGARNPGTSFAGQNNQHTIGTLQVHSPVMQTYFVDVTGGTSDQLKVIGALNLSGVTLNLSVPSGSPAAGDTFTIIDNDGSDAVNGTFSGLAEGAALTAGGFHFTISYHGGDGNDVVLTALASTKSWTGATSGNWSDPSNWNPHAVPANGEELLFPAGVPTTMNNDLSGLTAGKMTFKDTYTLNGNPLTLGGNVVFDTSTNIYWFCYVDLKLGQSINLGASLQNVYTGTIDVNGHTLTTDWYNTEFHGAIKGTGSIVAHDALLARGGGTFSGNISGAVDVAGSMPNANVDATSAGGNSSVSGSGSLGDVTATYVSPGARNPATSFAGQNNQHTIGTLQVHSPVMQTYFADLVPGGTSDQLKVIGAVNLGGVNLKASVPAGAPATGEAFTIIDNDGGDAVNGTFSGLPEGASLTISGFQFTISYHGGDGNDVVLATVASTKSWTGATSGNWSDPSNWTPHAIPANGEELLFPAGARTTMNNDLSGLTAGRMTFKDTYTLNGNPLTLGGNIVFDTSTNIYWFCNVDLKLGQSINLGASLQNIYTGAIDVNGHTLTTDWYNTEFHGAFKGTGSIVAHDALLARGGGTFSGNISGAVDVAGSMPDANVDTTSAGGNASVSGNGSLGDVTTIYLSPGARNPATSFAGQNNQHTIGTLEVHSPVMQTYFVDLVPGGTSDQLKVIGTVHLSGVTLDVSIPSGAPSTGQTFTIIDNDGADAVSGTFKSLPEGARVNVGPYPFRITYQGGDGNDVVLTSAVETSVVVIQSAANTFIGEPVTFVATASSQAGTPVGSVTLMIDGVPAGTSSLQQGSTQFSTATLHAGQHSIVAVYAGDGSYLGGASAPVTHEVKRGPTNIAMALNKTAITFGDTIVATVSLAVVAPAAGVPTGTITIRADGNEVASAPVANGGAAIPLASLHGGTHALTATYSGNDDFASSESGATSVTVEQVATTLNVTAGANPVAAGHVLALTVRVAPQPTAGSSSTVTVREHGALLAQQSITRTATVKLQSLAPGSHELAIAYAGNSDYSSSSATLTVTVTPPALSVDDASVPEGDAATNSAPISVHLSAASEQTVRVAWSTADGSAVAGRDYQSASGALEFAPGETEKHLSVVINGNTSAEDDRMFLIVLSDPVNAVVERTSAAVVITDDDATWRKLGELTYAQTPSGPLTLDLYAPIVDDGPRPLVIWIPGSSSYGGDGGASIALRETTRGYLVAVVRYRSPAAAHFPAQLDDLQAAVRWLRANAAQFNIIPDRIAAWGNGTGAHLAALLGTAANDRVQAVIDWNGASDLATMVTDSSCWSSDSSAESALIGCSPAACPDAARTASPLTFAGARSAAFLIMHGADNCLVGAAQSRKLHDALKSAGADSLLYIINGAGLIDPFWSSITARSAADEFLDVHLKGAPARHRPAH